MKQINKEIHRIPKPHANTRVEAGATASSERGDRTNHTRSFEVRLARRFEFKRVGTVMLRWY